MKLLITVKNYTVTCLQSFHTTSLNIYITYTNINIFIHNIMCFILYLSIIYNSYLLILKRFSIKNNTYIYKVYKSL